MLRKLVLVLALLFGALALSPTTSQAVPFGTATTAVAKEGALTAEPARWRRYRYYRRYYRPRRFYHRRYVYPRRYYHRRYYYPRRHYYRRYWW